MSWANATSFGRAIDVRGLDHHALHRRRPPIFRAGKSAAPRARRPASAAGPESARVPPTCLEDQLPPRPDRVAPEPQLEPGPRRRRPVRSLEPRPQVALDLPPRAKSSPSAPACPSPPPPAAPARRGRRPAHRTRGPSAVKHCYVVGVTIDGLADRAGVRPGAEILTLDAASVAGLGPENAVRLLAPAGIRQARSITLELEQSGARRSVTLDAASRVKPR